MTLVFVQVARNAYLLLLTRSTETILSLGAQLLSLMNFEWYKVTLRAEPKFDKFQFHVIS